MDRLEVLQKIIDSRQARTYLEIGVNDGYCFFAIRAPRKIAVDPVFLFGRRIKLKQCLKNLCNLFNSFFQTTSDDYFAKQAGPLAARGLDVVFIDGLHTYAQALTDVKNSLKFLNPGGVIVMHDCNPHSAAAAFPTSSHQEAQRAKPPGWDGAWCGDVWKTIVHLRVTRDDLNVFVLDCDFGVGVVSKGIPEGRLNLSADQVTAMSYADLAPDRTRLLNLKEPDYLEKFLKQPPS